MELKEIHKDERGTIAIITGDLRSYPEVTVFRTNAGYARGGCIHNIHQEYVCVIEGEVLYVYGDDKKQVLLSAGNSFMIPSVTPHYFLSVTDSVVMEWGATPEEKAAKHAKFRAEVDKLNREMKNDTTIRTSI